MTIDTQELKSMAPIIPYIKEHYKDKIIIEKETKDVAFAKCIFHEENDPSLAIYSNGTYKCFGCGEHGDLITLVQKIENVDFQTACTIIADNVGYEIHIEQENPAWTKYKDDITALSRKYWTNLQNNAVALNYLINVRRINPEMINKFHLGLTDQEEWKFRKDINNISNKIVFPILEHKRNNAKCVGMAYKGIIDEKPKYINDHNQDGRDGQDPNLNGVFIKGNMLYGMAQAYKSISANNFVFVVEGYFDVISMHQSGLENTIGIMGSSLTKEQIMAIKKVTNNVFLLLDNDEAGKKARDRYILELIKNDIKPVICSIEPFKDPDEMCKSLNFDQQKVINFLNKDVKDGVHFLMYTEIEKYKSIMLREKKRVYSKLYPIINGIPNFELRDLYLQELRKELF